MIYRMLTNFYKIYLERTLGTNISDKQSESILEKLYLTNRGTVLYTTIHSDSYRQGNLHPLLLNNIPSNRDVTRQAVKLPVQKSLMFSHVTQLWINCGSGLNCMQILFFKRDFVRSTVKYFQTWNSQVRLKQSKNSHVNLRFEKWIGNLPLA